MASKLTFKNLQKEFARNKAKSVALSVMCVVALYLWGPLIWGWVAPDSFVAEESVSVNEEMNKPVSPVPTVAQSARSQADRSHVRWDKLLHWMDEDPWMQSANLAVDDKDPFHWFSDDPREMLVVEEDVETEITEVQVALTPKELGLVLNSTFVGRVARQAKINGKRYREGDKIVCNLRSDPRFIEQIASGEVKDTVEFVLTEVRAKHVLLTRERQSHQLSIERAKFGRKRFEEDTLPTEDDVETPASV